MIDIILTFLLVCAALLGLLLGGALLICAVAKFLELQKEEQIFIIGFIVVAILITGFLIANNIGVALPTVSHDTDDNDTESVNHSSTITPVVKPIIPVTNPSTGMTTII